MKVNDLTLTMRPAFLEHTPQESTCKQRNRIDYQNLGIIVTLPLEFTNLIGPVRVAWLKHRPTTAATKLLLASLKATAAALS